MSSSARKEQSQPIRFAGQWRSQALVGPFSARKAQHQISRHVNIETSWPPWDKSAGPFDLRAQWVANQTTHFRSPETIATVHALNFGHSATTSVVACAPVVVIFKRRSADSLVRRIQSANWAACSHKSLYCAPFLPPFLSKFHLKSAQRKTGGTKGVMTARQSRWEPPASSCNRFLLPWQAAYCCSTRRAKANAQRAGRRYATLVSLGLDRDCRTLERLGM